MLYFFDFKPSYLHNSLISTNRFKFNTSFYVSESVCIFVLEKVFKIKIIILVTQMHVYQLTDTFVVIVLSRMMCIIYGCHFIRLDKRPDTPRVYIII